MAGKASFFLIIGLTTIFLVAVRNFGSISNRAVDNIVGYYNDMIAHNIAVSGANMAANQIFFDPTWDEGYDDLSFEGGEINVSVNIVDAYKNIREIKSEGEYRGTTSIVSVILSPSKFSKFAYYSVNEGGSIWWTNNDTVWGPFHTQDYLRASKHPVFFGKATCKRSVVYYSSKSKDAPIFKAGFQQGVDLPLPIDGVETLKTYSDDDGLTFTAKDTVYLLFDEDSLKYKFNYSSSYTVTYLPDAAPNGVIFAENAVIRMKGVVKGQYTIGCSTSGSSGKGTVYLDDDIVYKQDPRQYPTSSDLLGICAENNVYITNNIPNRSSINIHASVYCEKGGFGAEQYDTRPVSGSINLLGGIIQNTRKAVGTFSGSTITHGFAKKYRYDDRLMIASPPFYPGTGGFEIVSWLE
ncbi:MAG: hypothetical protein HXY49_10795 [Ignavibacteriaceae bacterium]|nr:hypothetical protein [Ignavibacteriaceae bacterium]